MLDVLIVGGGPAGLNAALTLGRARYSVLLCDAGAPRNGGVHAMHNFLRTYAVARLCANVACSNPANSALGPARNCCMAGRMISSLVSNQRFPGVIR